MKPYPDDTGGGCFRFDQLPHSNQVDLRHKYDKKKVRERSERFVGGLAALFHLPGV